MNTKYKLIIGCMIFSLSSCGGDPDLSKNLNEMKEVTKGLAFSSEKLSQAHASLKASFDQAATVSDRITYKAKLDQKNISQNIIYLRKEQANMIEAFSNFNKKISALEGLYIKEGVIELSNDEGKINVERFPALAQTECVFIEDHSCFPRASTIEFKGRIQSNGMWKINGKDYKLFDNMTFEVETVRYKLSSEAAKFSVVQVTFKNTHGEIVTTKKARGYLISVEGHDRIKWSLRELSGRQQAFIPKGQKCILVLSSPLNLGIRK